MNAVIYARYSSDNQREESIEGQLRECKEYAERSGMNVVATYIDRALSAKTDDRPQFQQMIRDSNTHKFEVVLVWKLDRFSRNRYDSANYKSGAEPCPCCFRNGADFKHAGGNHAGKPVGGDGRILFRRAIRKGFPWAQGKRAEGKVQRRDDSTGIPH